MPGSIICRQGSNCLFMADVDGESLEICSIVANIMHISLDFYQITNRYNYLWSIFDIISAACGNVLCQQEGE